MNIVGTSTNQAPMTQLSKFLALETNNILLDGNLVRQTNTVPYLYNRVFFLSSNAFFKQTNEYVDYNTLPNSWKTAYKFGISYRSYIDNRETLEIDDNYSRLYAVISYVDVTDYFSLDGVLYKPVMKIGRDGFTQSYTNNNANNNDFFPLVEEAIGNNYILDPDYVIRERDGIIITDISFYNGNEKIDKIPVYIGTTTMIQNNSLSEKYAGVTAFTIVPIFAPQSDSTNHNIILDKGRFLGTGNSNVVNIQKYTPFSYIIQITDGMYFTPLNEAQSYNISENGLVKTRYYRTSPIQIKKTGIFAESLESVVEYLNDCGFEVVESVGAIPPQVNPPDDKGDVPNLKDDSSDIIEILPPNISISDYTSSYIYRQPEVKSLTDWFISNTFIDDIVRLYQSPIDSILSLKVFSVDFVTHDSLFVNSADTVSILNVSTALNGYKFRLGYNYIIKGGEYHYIAYYGDYNDYVNTQYNLYVPYVGIVKLNSNDVVNKTIKILYAVDPVADNSQYFITSDDIIIKCGNCNMGVDIPFLSSNYNEVLRNGILTTLSGFVSGNLGDVIKPFVSSDIDYKINGKPTTNILTRLIPPYLLITKTSPQKPTKLYSLDGMPTTSSGNIADFNKTSGDNFISGNIVKISTLATEAERNIIMNLVKNGIYV